MLTVITPAKSYDLTTVAAVKAEMGITDRDDDAVLSRYIKQASDAVAQYCNRVFPLETVSETFRAAPIPAGYRQSAVMLQRYPVTEVVSVSESGSLLDPSLYEIDADDGTLHRLGDSGNSACWSSGTLIIVYTAGFAIPGGLPNGVERATIQLVKQYAGAGDRDPSVKSERVDGAGTTEYFDGDPTGLPPDVQGLLNFHIKPNG